MCSSPELPAEEMDHLGKVLRYDNYPKWMIKQEGRSNLLTGGLIDPETGNEVKKTVFISAPYFLGLSESFKQLFRHTHIQVLFQGSKYHQINAHAPQRPNRSFPQKGHCLSMVMHQPRMQILLHWGDLQVTL